MSINNTNIKENRKIKDTTEKKYALEFKLMKAFSVEHVIPSSQEKEYNSLTITTQIFEWTFPKEDM